jgi:hypothetical protein
MIYMPDDDDDQVDGDVYHDDGDGCDDIDAFLSR